MLQSLVKKNLHYFIAEKEKYLSGGLVKFVVTKCKISDLVQYLIMSLITIRKNVNNEDRSSCLREHEIIKNSKHLFNIHLFGVLS